MAIRKQYHRNWPHMERIACNCGYQLFHSFNCDLFQWYASFPSYFTATILLTSGQIGATGVIYHAPFPVLARASWGFWGSYIAIISRAILAIFWFAIQTMNGANTVRVMLGAIWPSFLTLPNHIPASQGIATNTMISFFLFWLIQVPFLYMHPNNLRWLFMVKSIIVPIAWIAILVWAFVSTKHDEKSIFDQHTSISGSAYSWVCLFPVRPILEYDC
jgi:NCS1 family nucleobase:cation symporter-1